MVVFRPLELPSRCRDASGPDAAVSLTPSSRRVEVRDVQKRFDGRTVQVEAGSPIHRRAGSRWFEFRNRGE